MLKTEKRRSLLSLSAYCSIIMWESPSGLDFAGTSPLPQKWHDIPSLCSSVVMGNSCYRYSDLTFCSIISAKINKSQGGFKAFVLMETEIESGI
jgi:hypothetical protein